MLTLSELASMCLLFFVTRTFSLFLNVDVKIVTGSFATKEFRFSRDQLIYLALGPSNTLSNCAISLKWDL